MPQLPCPARGPLVAIAAPVLLLMLYVASAGPAIWLYEHELVSPRPLEVIYAPLSWTYESCQPAAQVLDWYVGFWQKNSPGRWKNEGREG